MPTTVVRDIEGCTIQYFEFQGKYFPHFANIGDNLLRLPNLPARDGDVMIVAYPRSGTHWLWEVVTMLTAGKPVGKVRDKSEGMLEYQSREALGALPSVRLLNTHLTPEFYPTELVKKKVKVIHLMRNPKDVFVSYFHFQRSLVHYNYHGSWNGFFNLVMDRKNSYGSWFDFTKSWDSFFKQHAEVPVLTLFYEDMKKNLYEVIKQLADFLDVPCDDALSESIVVKCSFDNVKADREDLTGDIDRGVYKGDTCANPNYRKGIVGDWKNLFTVAQNERFNAEYKQQMAGWTLSFEQHMGL